MRSIVRSIIQSDIKKKKKKAKLKRTLVGYLVKTFIKNRRRQPIKLSNKSGKYLISNSLGIGPLY